MNILQAAGEAVPFCKTGGLADVAGALSKELSHRKHNTVLVLPLYRQIDRTVNKIIPTGVTLTIRMGRISHEVPVWERKTPQNPKCYFLESPYYDRNGLYGETPGTAFDDNAERYILYAKAVLELCRVFEFKPDIIHGHDWQAGLIPAYLKTVYRRDPFFANTGSVFSIHNMAYQGMFPASAFMLTGLPSSEYGIGGIEFFGQINFLKAGLIYSDALNTVSPTYANEIQNDWNYGYGLEGVLNSRRDRFRGITNGIDHDIWNPKSDPHIAQKYDHTKLQNKAVCKEALQKKCGWPANPKTPVVGFIGRLDQQKGIDFLIQLVPRLARKEAQVVMLGSGDANYQSLLRDLHRDYPGAVYYESAFAEPFSHQIYAGADIFLMPSKFEPCGLSQLISMRYGTVPVVTPTGGLVDTVKPGTGFMSKSKSYGDFVDSVFTALDEWTKKRTWQSRQKRVMMLDHSWGPSVHHYIDMYRDAIRWNGKLHA